MTNPADSRHATMFIGLRPLLAAALIVGIGTACQPPGEGKGPGSAAPGKKPTDKAEPAKPGIQVSTVVLSPTSFEDRIEVTGALEADKDAVLSAQSAGTVQRLLPLGTQVRNGQSVATLDAELSAAAVKQAEAQVTAARASAALAKDNHKRQKPLFDDGIISALEFDNITAQLNQANAQLSQAEAMLTQAKKQMANTRVQAPFAGLVEEHYVEQGEQVNPGSRIARVTDTRTMKVKAGMPERYAADIKPGASIEIAFNAYGLKPVQGKLTFVGRTINPRNRTFLVEAEVGNPDGTLKPEMVARLLVTRARLSEVLTVPLAAVLRDETGDAVFLVDRKGSQATVRRQRVVTGPTSGRMVVIDEGLKTGDEVVVEGQTNVTRGDKVEVSRRDNEEVSSK